MRLLRHAGLSVSLLLGLLIGASGGSLVTGVTAAEERVPSAGGWAAQQDAGEQRHYSGSVSLDVSPDLLRRQVTLIGSWTFSSVGQEECAKFIAERNIPLGKLITHRFKLDGAAEAYRLFDTQTTGKGVFVF